MRNNILIKLVQINVSASLEYIGYRSGALTTSRTIY